jgi:hypothetical protein
VYTADAVALLSKEENRLKGTARLADEETKADVELRMVETLRELAAALAGHSGPFDPNDLSLMWGSGTRT